MSTNGLRGQQSSPDSSRYRTAVIRSCAATMKTCPPVPTISPTYGGPRSRSSGNLDRKPSDPFARVRIGFLVHRDAPQLPQSYQPATSCLSTTPMAEAGSVCRPAMLARIGPPRPSVRLTTDQPRASWTRWTPHSSRADRFARSHGASTGRADSAPRSASPEPFTNELGAADADCADSRPGFDARGGKPPSTDHAALPNRRRT